MKFVYGILLTVLALGAVAWAQPTNKIDTALQESLQRNGHANIMVSFKDGTKDILDKFDSMSFSTDGERTQAIYDALTSRARNSQQKILRYLSTPSISKQFQFVNVQSFWITNQICIQRACDKFVKHLATMEEVSLIKEEAIVHLPKPIESRQVSDMDFQVMDTIQWGVERIRAPEVWDKGIDGEGVTVGVIDTGCNVKHKDLKDNYRNDEYSWLDVVAGSKKAYDDHGHGSHVTGTAVGRNGIGVAPNAKFISCKGLNAAGHGSTSNLLKCCQFMACPTTWNGKFPKCEKRPKVVNMSWGSTKEMPDYLEAMDTMVAFGIVVAASAGNAGPSCSTIGSPANYEAVISVGATNAYDSLWSSSSRGPVKDNDGKPDLVAPGERIVSASHLLNGYQTESGTSMATPHVTGAVALILNQNPNLSVDEIKLLLTDTANRAVQALGNCGGKPNTEIPNHLFGYGRLDSLNAYNKLKTLSG